MNYVIAVIIGIIVAFVIAAIQKSSLTSVTMQHAAADYVKKGSVKFRIQTERFLYRKVEKTEKQQK
ncbi:MAG: hypothetical protein MJ095_07560 [Oscillospiraceae bacterium]|nr:hypothetical protein [Oscillospiraceae bacterium]